MKKNIFLGVLLSVAILVVSFLSLEGCSKSVPHTNIATTNVVTAEALQDIMYKAMNNTAIAAGLTADAVYSLPSEDWIKTTFAASYLDFLKSMKSNGYISEENDCDKYAVLAYAYAHILHHNTAFKIQKTGLTFGEFWYSMRNNGGGHAINVIVVKDKDGNNKVLFFEPQTQQEVELTKEEKESCSFWRF